MRKAIDKHLNKLELEQDEVKRLRARVTELSEEVRACEVAQAVMQEAAKLSQQHLATHLSNIVTQAIQAVIEKPYEFVCEFIERRGSTEADFYLEKDGERFEILGGTGGGLADVCSFALKVAYLLLSNVDKVLIIDEVSRHINSKKQRENFAEVLAKLVKEFNIQVVVNTTIPELIDKADRVFDLSQTNGVTKVSLASCPT